MIVNNEVLRTDLKDRFIYATNRCVSQSMRKKYNSISDMAWTNTAREYMYREILLKDNEFTIDDASAITYLAAIVNYDNGAVLYLNGHEAGRLNMPASDVGYDTLAATNASGLKALLLNYDYLQDGVNVLAVEMHQHAADMDDMTFDLRLLTPAPVIEFGDDWYYFDAGREPDTQTSGTGIARANDEWPTRFALHRNYPNPFNPVTTIRYQISEACEVYLRVFDALGREVAELVRVQHAPGEYAVVFDGTTLSSGFYFVQMRVGEFDAVHKMILLK